MFRSRTKDSDCSASFADSEPISTSCWREKKLILRPFVRRNRTPNRTFAMPELDHRFGDRHRISCSSENWRLSPNYHSNLRAGGFRTRPIGSSGVRPQIQPHFVVAHFAFPNFGAFALAPACPVLQPDMPTMPATDHFSCLHESFTEWEAQVRAQILDSVDAVVPAEERKVQPFGFGGVAKSFSRQFR